MVNYLGGVYQVSQRRACEVARIPVSTFRYQSTQEPRTALRLRIREIAQARVRYGYRKIRVLLKREGWNVGKKLVYRLYCEEGLALRYKPRRRRCAAANRRERGKVTAPNQAWSLDFVADQLADGRRFRALTIVDVCTRESLAIEAGQSLKAADVVRVLSRICLKRATPKTLFCDNGSEFTSQAMDLWAYHAGVQIDFSRPGKPTDNAYVESFNGTLRSECLDAHWFATLAEARQVIEAWRQEYNESRPHRALGESDILTRLGQKGFGSYAIERMEQARELIPDCKFELVISLEKVDGGSAYDLMSLVRDYGGSLVVGVQSFSGYLWLTVLITGKKCWGQARWTTANWKPNWKRY